MLWARSGSLPRPDALQEVPGLHAQRLGPGNPGQDDIARIPGYRSSYQFTIGGPTRGDENSFKLVVENIRRAIEEKTDLEIAYKGSGGQTRRRVTPKYIKGMNMRARCHMRNEDRSFRLDRIVEVAEVAPKPKP